MRICYTFIIIMATLASTLRIGCWNVRGLSASIPYLRELLDSSDIFCVSEHWLHRNRLNCLDDISKDFLNFSRASKSSTENNFGLKRGQGGVAIMWRKELSGVSVIDNILHDRICGLRIQDARGTTLVILSVYMPAVGAHDDLSDVLDDVSNIIDNLDEDVVPILCGDFNGDMGNMGGPRGLDPPTRAGRLVADFMYKHNMIATNMLDVCEGPIHTFESHNGSSCIDYVMIPSFMENAVVSCRVENEHALNTSDHNPVILSIEVDKLPCKIKGNDKKRNLKWDKWDAERMFHEYQSPLAILLGDITDRIVHSECNPAEIDQFFDELIAMLHKAAEVIPRSKYVNHLKPYWDDELTHLKREKVKYFKIWKGKGRSREKEDPDRVNMCLSKKMFTKRLRQLSKSYYNEQIAKATQFAEIDKNMFWKVFRKTKGDNRSSSHAIKNASGDVVYTMDEVLQVWRSHFDKISTPKHSDDYDGVHFNMVSDNVRLWLEEANTSEFLAEPFSYAEVESAVLKLHLNKAPGYDNITTEHIRNAGHAIVPTLCELYNACVSSEYVPSCFRKGVQVPLYKGKGSCSLNPDNYRGITLLSNFNKLYEVLIWSRI